MFKLSQRKNVWKIVGLIFLLSFPFSTGTASLKDRDWLEKWYQGYNHKYFGDELPAAIIVHTLKDEHRMAETEQAGTYYEIRMNPKYEPSEQQARMTLLHEMCHVENLASPEPVFEDHGRVWQGCMHDLANEGAFEDLW